MTEKVTEEKSYLKDWTLNIAKKSAMHCSGIEYKYIPQGEEGKPRLKIANMPEWFKAQMAQGKTSDECYAELDGLSNQFIAIAEDIILPAAQEYEQQLKKARGGYE